MTDNDTIEVQRLRAARVQVMHDDPGNVVLQMSGVNDAYYVLAVGELANLAARLTADAKLLATQELSGGAAADIAAGQNPADKN